MPSESSPRSFAFSMRIGAPPFPTGTVAPTGAKGYFRPAVTLGAPHTTCRRSVPPSFTVQTRRRSAFGMLAHLFHERHADVAQSRVERLDHVHRGALCGEARADVLRIERPTQEALEPAAGDVHGASRPVPRVNCERKRMSPSYSSRMSGTP